MECDRVAVEIWIWVLQHHCWLYAEFIPGVDNTVADYLSRNFNDRKEWQLHPSVFQICCHILGCMPDVDLFASRLNTQLPTFMSYFSDPEAIAIDAFRHSWSEYNLLYIFCPFSCISMVLQRILVDQLQAIIIVPYWETAVWFARLLQMMVRPPLLLRPSKHLLRLPHQPDDPHPLHRKLKLLVAHISGAPSVTPHCHQRHEKSYYTDGGRLQTQHMTATWTNGTPLQRRTDILPLVQVSTRLLRS